MDERSLVLLRRKLEALSYHDTLEANSAPLVAKLVDDLVRTSDSYRLLKIQNEQANSEITSLQTKLDIVKQESSRLTNENNQLHAQLIAEADRLEEVQKSSYQQVKRLEDQIADLAFWKSQAVSRYEGLEKEHAAVKKRVAELVAIGEKRSKGGYDAVEDAFKLSMGKPLDAVPAPPQPPPPSLLRLQAAQDAHAASLQRQLEQRQLQLEDLQSELEAARQQVQRRDAEVTRLSSCLVAGPDVDRLELERRADANNGIILTLTQQVDQLNAQVAQLTAAAEDKTKLEAALKASDKARLEAEEVVRQLRRHNSDTQRDVAKLQQELAGLALKQAKSGASASHELDTAMAMVAELKADLAKAKTDKQQLQEQHSSAQAARKAAEEQAARLQAQVEQLQFLVDEGHAKADSLEQQVSTMSKQPAKQQQQPVEQQQQNQQHQQQLASLQQQLATQEAAMEQLLKARDEAQRKLSDATQQLQAESAAAGRAKEAAAAAESRLTQLTAELARKESELAAAREASDAATQQLKAANTARQQLTAASTDAHAAAADIKQQAQGLLVQLQQANDRVDELTQERISLQAECTQLRNQLAIARTDAESAQQRLQQQGGRLASDQSRLQQQGQQLGQLVELQHQAEELQQQLAVCKQRLAATEAQLKQATLAAAVKGTVTSTSSQHLQELQQLLDDVTADKDAAEGLLQDARAQAAAHASAAKRAEAERDRAVKERKAAEEALEALRASLDKGSAEVAAADARTSGLQGRLSTAHQQLSQQEAELDRLHGLLAAAEDAAKAARGREEAARAQGREYAERARRAETLCEEADAELAQVKAQLEDVHGEVVQLQQANARLGADLAGRTAELEQLKTLSIAGHTTLQEYTGKLKSMTTELRGYAVKVTDLEGQVRYKEEALAAANTETANLHKALRSVDAERDQLQAAVDDKDATIGHLQQELEILKLTADDGRRQLAAAEGRVAHVNQRAAELSAEVASLQEQLAGALQQLGALDGEHAALKDEFRAMGEDMEALVRENQVVSSELATASHHGGQARDEVGLLRSRLAATEQLLRSKEAEVEDVRHAYEGLAVEHRRAQSTLLQLEREAALRESALAAKLDEVASLQEGLRGAQMQINQYLLDLQAYERQVDHLSRQLSRDAADTQQVAQDRETLLEELRAAQQVRLTLERSIEDLQRQLASMDAQNALLQARLGDSEAEVEGLQQRAALERGRVAELEGLLANLRAKEFRSGMETQKSGGQLGAVTERNKLLQQQVTTLQQQVTALQQSRDVQDRELARLRTEALELAQRTAAAAVAATGPSAGAGSSGGAASAAAALQAQRDMQAALSDQAAALQRADQEQQQLQQQLAQVNAENKKLTQQLRDAQFKQSRGTGSSGGSRLGPPDTSYRQQWEAAESRVGDMQEEMTLLQERAQQQEQQLVDAQSKLEQLYNDKAHLLEMLSQLDAEKSALNRRPARGMQQQLLLQQQGAPGTPTSAAAGSQISGSGSSMPGGGVAATTASVDSLEKLQSRLQEEQQKRLKAERDFLSLMTSIEQDSSAAGRGSSRTGSP